MRSRHNVNTAMTRREIASYRASVACITMREHGTRTTLRVCQLAPQISKFASDPRVSSRHANGI